MTPSTTDLARLAAAPLLFAIGLTVQAGAQTPVGIGRGSHASSIPPDKTEFWAGKDVNVGDWHATVPLHVAGNLKPPYPTNDWWSSLLFENNVRKPAQLWAHPLGITVQPYGLGVHYANTWSGINGSYRETAFLEIPEPLQIRGRDFHPINQEVLAWGDWTVRFRILESAAKSMDVTIGHGLPAVWLEFHGIGHPQVSAPGAMFFNDKGEPLVLPFTGDHVGLAWSGRAYGIHAPDGTGFAYADGVLTLTPPAGRTHLTITALPAKDKLGYFHHHAYAVPRDSRMDWKYDASDGKIHTSWSLETEVLKGSNRAVIQGWIPHHYRGTTHALAFDGNDYVTARGKLRCTAGTRFDIAWDFRGVPGHLPAPDSPEFDRKRMDSYLDGFAAWPHPFNAETYAGGKQVAMFARQLACARMLGHPAVDVIRKRLRDELENVFTYTPGEPDKFFARADRLGGMIGFRCGFGSHRFNDHHFHYGYYVYAAAILGMLDQEFLAGYGEMAKLLAKEYANWDRGDSRFPYLRTFDIWEGHSWANGGADNSPWFGQNQESSSEAMMSWAAVLLLGNALDDPAMTAAGAMGHAIEASATDEYWFNRHHDNFPPAYGPPGRISCITWGNQIQYITYFGPEPVFVHGIQYLPILPSSNYLVRHRAAAAEEFRYLLANSQSSAYTRFASRDSWEIQWANEVIRHASMVDNTWARDWFEDLWRNRDPKANDPWEAGLTYYFIHANRMLGSPCQDTFVDSPDSGVYLDPASGRLTAFASNPTGATRTCRVRRHGTTIGTFTVAARGVHAIRLDNPSDHREDPK